MEPMPGREKICAGHAQAQLHPPSERIIPVPETMSEPGRPVPVVYGEIAAAAVTLIGGEARLGELEALPSIPGFAAGTVSALVETATDELVRVVAPEP